MWENIEKLWENIEHWKCEKIKKTMGKYRTLKMWENIENYGKV